MAFSFRNSPLAILVAIAASASAQFDTAPKVTAKLSSSAVVAGKTAQLVLTVTFPDGLHAYQNPPTDPTLIPITVKPGDKAFKVVKVVYPKGTPTKIGGESTPVAVYAGTIQIPVTIMVPTKLGKTTLTLNLGYQQCNDQSCFPPGTVPISVPINVVKTAPAKAKAKA